MSVIKLIIYLFFSKKTFYIFRNLSLNMLIRLYHQNAKKWFQLDHKLNQLKNVNKVLVYKLIQLMKLRLKLFKRLYTFIMIKNYHNHQLVIKTLMFQLLNKMVKKVLMNMFTLLSVIKWLLAYQEEDQKILIGFLEDHLGQVEWICHLHQFQLVQKVEQLIFHYQIIIIIIPITMITMKLNHVIQSVIMEEFLHQDQLHLHHQNLFKEQPIEEVKLFQQALELDLCSKIIYQLLASILVVLIQDLLHHFLQMLALIEVQLQVQIG